MVLREWTPSRQRAVGVAGGLLAIAAVVVAVVGVPTSSSGEWAGAWVTSPASRTLMVRVVGQDGFADACGAPQARVTVSETADEVRVAVRAVRYLGIAASSCFDVGYGPTSHPVELAAPIGDRRVVEDWSGAVQPLLVVSRASTITGLPGGLVTTDLGVDSLDGGVDRIQRVWRSREDDGQVVLLSVAAGPGAATRLSRGKEVTANGQTVEMSGRADRPRDVYYFQWTTDTGRRVNVDVHLDHGVWTAAQALDIVTRTTRIS